MNLQAPPAAGVMWHIKQDFPSKEKALAFIVDYAKHPDAKKAICPSIRRFGVMPDVASHLSDEQLRLIAEYWYDNYPARLLPPSPRDGYGPCPRYGDGRYGPLTPPRHSPFRGDYLPFQRNRSVIL